MGGPDTGTEENEAKMEFERRLGFANHWLNLFGGCRWYACRRRAGEPTGWNTSRGRISGVEKS